MTIELKYHKLWNDVPDLKFATQRSACMDVCAHFGSMSRMYTVYDKNNNKCEYYAFQLKEGDPIRSSLNPGDRAMIPTGIVLDIPEGYSVRVHPRSGLSLKRGLTLFCCEGIVDEDYVEQLFIPVVNTSSKVIDITDGERIAQLELVPTLKFTAVVTGDRPQKKTDRIGGFGSTS